MDWEPDATLGDLKQALAVEGRSRMRDDINRAQRLPAWPNFESAMSSKASNMSEPEETATADFSIIDSSSLAMLSDLCRRSKTIFG